MDKQIEYLRSQYMKTPIPEGLDFVVSRSLQDCRVLRSRKKRWARQFLVPVASIAIVLVILTAGVNVSPVLAESLVKVPLLGSLVKVLTFREYSVQEDTYDMNVKVPVIDGLQNQNLQEGLNQKYLQEGKQLYESFMADMADLKQNGDGHLGMESGYEVVTDTDSILSIGRYVVNTVGSSSTTYHFDTVDKKNEILITLPSLFKDEKYIDIISGNIKQQMIEKNKADSSKFYWVEGIEQSVPMELFEKIAPDQNFYINSENKLVISFDKYEVAPGYMGIVQFVIPTEILANDRVSDLYIK